MKRLFDLKAFHMLLSVFLAVIFWLYVIDVEDPERSVVFHDVPVDVIGENILESQGLTIAEMSQETVNLTIRAPYSTLSVLDSSNLSVSIDVSKMSTAGEFSTAYTLVLPNHVNSTNLFLENRNPTQLTVFVDKLHSEIFPVEFVLRGSIAGGYQAGQHTISPEVVTINGSFDAVAQVNRVVVVLEQENLAERYTGELALVLLDNQGEIIEDTSLDLSETTAFVTVPVVMEREIPLVVQLIPGGGATDSNVSNLTISPATIKVSGVEEDIIGLEEISLGSIDLSRVMDEKTFTFPIAVDSSLKNDSGISEASVTVTIEGLATQTFETTNIQLVNAPAGYVASPSTQVRTVVVRGSEEDLALVDPSHIRIVADLSDISASGSATVPAKVFLDSVGDVGATGDYTIVVNITKE